MQLMAGRGDCEIGSCLHRCNIQQQQHLQRSGTWPKLAPALLLHPLCCSAATFSKLFIHGRHDLVAPAAYAHSLAERLGAPFVELPGAHFVTRESSRQVSDATFVAVGSCIGE